MYCLYSLYCYLFIKKLKSSAILKVFLNHQYVFFKKYATIKELK